MNTLFTIERAGRRRVRHIGATLLITGCALAASLATPAVADSPNDFADEIASIPGATQVIVDATVPEGEKITEGFEGGGSSLTPEWNLALIRLEHSNVTPIVNSVEWSQTDGYTIYAHGDAEAVTHELKAILPEFGWRVVATKYSKAELLEETARILDSPELLRGELVSVVGPKFDGSGLRLGLVGDAEEKPHLTAVDLRSEYPIDIFVGSPWTHASRQADSSPYKGGAITYSVQGSSVYNCSTGFKVGTGSPVVSSMLFADHCSSNGWAWQSGQYALGLGTNAVLGYGQGQVGGFLDMERIGSSIGTTLPTTAAYVYVGSASPSGTITGIWGYTASPPIGSSVCMTGGYTGQVCNNVVTNVDQVHCDPFPTACWQHQTDSVQSGGSPAAGSGDSGGPVIVSVGGKAYAAGIIASIGAYASTCIGQPASEGRVCSAEVSWTPMSQFFSNNSAVLYVAGPS